MIVAAADSDAPLTFIEIGAIAVGLGVLARVAGRLGITAIPFCLLAGLAVGEGGVAPLDVSAEFISTAAEIGVLLLLLALGLEYSSDELRHGLRTGLVPGLVDGVVNFAPGFLAGVLLGWELAAAVLQSTSAPPASRSGFRSIDSVPPKPSSLASSTHPCSSAMPTAVANRAARADQPFATATFPKLALYVKLMTMATFTAMTGSDRR